MEDMHRTHKEPAWGWIGALLDAAKPAAPAKPAGVRPRRPTSAAVPATAPARRAAC